MADPYARGARLFAELKRRRVVRAALAYLGAAFVVLQAADLLMEPLGLGDGVFRVLVVAAIAGFPMTLVLAWLFDIRRDTGGEGGPAPAGRPIPARVVMGIAAAALLGAVAFAGVLRFTAPPMRGSTTLAVLPFTVRGDPSLDYLSDGLVDLLSRNLDGHEDLRVLAPELVLAHFDNPVQTASLLPLSGGQDVARKIGARYYLVGSVHATGGRLRISAALHDQRRDPEHTLLQVSEEGTEAELLEIVDRISAAIMAGHDVRAASQMSEVAARTTRSIPALRAYLAGEHALRAAHFDSAVASFERAIEIDTAFSLAYYRAAWAASTSFGDHSYRGSSPRLANRALAHAHRLAPRERALVEALVAWQMGYADEAERLYRDLLAERPDDLEPAFGLGNVLLWYNGERGRPITEAREYLAKVLEDDPGFLCPI